MLNRMKVWVAYFLWLAPTFVHGKITIPVSDVNPLPLKASGAVSSAYELLSQSCPEEVADKNPYTPKLLLSSYSEFERGDDVVFNGSIYPSSDSVVRGAIQAWAHHESLILRPDAIWFEILAQLNFYMTKHAEDIRHLFVDFEGKKQILVKDTTWRSVIAGFANEIQKRVKTDWLLSWISPGFSTTTPNDNMTATVLMMGLMQHYFEFLGGITCGIPSITLLGTKEDWVKLEMKLGHLADFGEEPAQFAENLKPILKRFVQTWDEPNSPAIKAFWAQIVRAHSVFTCGSGPNSYDVSGWITGFIHWRDDGTLRVPADEAVLEAPLEDDIRLDNVSYRRVGLDKVSIGYAKAPLKMLDYPKDGEDTDAFVLAGNIGIKRTVVRNGGRNEVQAEPLSSWFLYGPVNSTYKTGPEYGNYTELEIVARELLKSSCPLR